MAGITGVTGDFRKLRRQIEAFAKFRADWKQDLARTLASTAKAQVQLQFNDQSDPYGRAWEPLAPSTLKSRRKGGAGAMILQDTRRLRNSFTFRGRGGRILIGTNVAYAAAQNYGHTYAARSSARAMNLTFSKKGRIIGHHGKGARARGWNSWSGHVTYGERVLPRRQIIPEGSAGPMWDAAFKRDTKVWIEKRLNMAKGAS